MAEDAIRRRGGQKSNESECSLLKTILLMVVVAVLTGEASANWPPCKSQCDTNFTKDDMLEHPGIKSVCHRGCELFTVALISTPRGGVPLVGSAFGQHGNFDITPDVAHLMGVSDDLLKRIDNRNLTGKKMPVKTTISNWEKAKKQKQELEQKIVHQMDSIGKTSHGQVHSRKQAVMARMEEETHNIMHRLAQINAEKAKQEKKTTVTEIVAKKTESSPKTPIDVKGTSNEENKKTLGHGHNENKQHEIKIETINGHEVISFDEDIDCDDLDVLEKMLTERKGLGVNQVVNSKNNFKQLVHSKISDKKPSGAFVVSKKPQVSYSVVTGETAKQIMVDARRFDKSPHTFGPVPVKPHLIHPEQQEKNKLVETAEHAKSHEPMPPHLKPVNSQLKSKKPQSHGPIPLASLSKRPAASQTQPKSALLHDPLSKTTVQPLSHPVQDHPVHANRQITTDSSDADERKTTTPKSSNPVAPVSQKLPEFGAFSLLANKLGLADKKRVHPFLHLTFLPPKPMFSFDMPQQISIIEIVKKKNNIDFEKLHQEHLKEAAQCPMIHERFEQAKLSCRHACATAFKETQEQDACVVGCQIQETSSTKQIKALTPALTVKKTHQRTTTASNGKPEDVIVRPGGLLSSFSMMFTNLAGKIGQSMHKMWDLMAHHKNGLSGRNGSPSVTSDGSAVPGQKDKKALGQPGGPHLGVQIFFKSIETGLDNPNIVSNTRPNERIINTESVFKFVDHQPPKSEADVLKEQIEHHDLLIQREMEREGNLLAQTIEMGQGGAKASENELNHQIEILGKHLNEKPRKKVHGVPIVPKFVVDFLFPRLDIVEYNHQKDESPSEKNVLEKNEMKLFEKLFQSKMLLDDLFKIKGNSAKKSHSHSQSDEQNSRKFEDLQKPVVEGKTPMKTSNTDCHTTSENLQMQELDLLACISRKSGLPRWLIAVTVFASALVVFYLCFSLATPVDESKVGKPKATTVVMCNSLEDECYEDDCYEEEKKLLPKTEELEIRIQTV